jgi:hypothetical protein
MAVVARRLEAGEKITDENKHIFGKSGTLFL